MIYIVIAYFVVFYLSLPGLLSKAGYTLIEGLIPIYNIYVLLTVLEINPFLLIMLSLGLIFLPDRMFIATLIFVFLPFILSNAYSRGIIFSILALVCPFLMFPILAYGPNSDYLYSIEDY